MTRRKLLGQGLAVAGVYLAAACGGSSEQPSQDSTAASASKAETVASPAAKPAAEQPPSADRVTLQEFPVPSGAHPHDVAPALEPNGIVWYTAQHQEALGILNPLSGETRHIHLGSGARPHGVIVGPDGAPWITDGGLNAIVRVDPSTQAVTVFPLPESTGYANLNTATFDLSGICWFTGQSGIYGRVDPETGELKVYEAPRGRGPYGICTTPDGNVYYASLAGSYVGHINTATGAVTELNPPTSNQGARRVWSDSRSRIWVAEWNTGQVSLYNPTDGSWREWLLPGASPRAYAVYVDEQDIVWLTDFGANALVRFDPTTETFSAYPWPSSGAAVRQLLGRPGEVWGAESGVDALVVARTASPG
ncbi:MAG: lyase [Chloroflexota bacterium]|nr:lyase [Chloroflexota bacterium]MDE2931432.1 lyase [Chloroflexota bacterium]